MITDQDIVKLKETFVTKEEFGDLKMEVGEIHDKLDALDTRVGILDAKVDSLDVKFDAMLDLLTGSMQEHSVGAVQYARYDRQIKALATATGVALPD